MASIVAVHGIGQQRSGPHTLRAEWLPRLRDGLSFAGVEFPRDDDLQCAFYGDLFRPRFTRSIDDPPFIAQDITDPDEIEFLEVWWREAASTERGSSPNSRTRGMPYGVQVALDCWSARPSFMVCQSGRSSSTSSRSAAT